MEGLPIIWRLRTLAFAALALAVFGAIECTPKIDHTQNTMKKEKRKIWVNFNIFIFSKHSEGTSIKILRRILVRN